MQDKQVFEYAVIRVVPKVEREEFVNVGVVLFCKTLDFLQAKIEIPEHKLSAFVQPAEMVEIRQYLQSFLQICEGDPKGGTIAALSVPERFRWLTATRSTVVQTSRVHPGICEKPELILEKLLEQLVQ